MLLWRFCKHLGAGGGGGAGRTHPFPLDPPLKGALAWAQCLNKDATHALNGNQLLCVGCGAVRWLWGSQIQWAKLWCLNREGATLPPQRQIEESGMQCQSMKLSTQRAINEAKLRGKCEQMRFTQPPPPPPCAPPRFPVTATPPQKGYALPPAAAGAGSMRQRSGVVEIQADPRQGGAEHLQRMGQAGPWRCPACLRTVRRCRRCPHGPKRPQPGPHQCLCWRQ